MGKKLTKQQRINRLLAEICKDIKVKKFLEERDLLKEKLASEGDISFDIYFKEMLKLRKKHNIVTAIGRDGSYIYKVEEVA
jgi:hypothetical protein